MTWRWSRSSWLRYVSAHLEGRFCSFFFFNHFFSKSHLLIDSVLLAPLRQRDRDLELAARIGQSLLQRNHLLQERNDALEEQLAQALDQVARVLVRASCCGGLRF